MARFQNTIGAVSSENIAAGESGADERLLVEQDAPGSGRKLHAVRLSAGFLDANGVGTVGMYVPSGVVVSGVNIAFNDADPDTIVRASGSYVTDGVNADDVVIVSGSAANDATYLCASRVALTLTLDADEALTTAGAAADITLTFLKKVWEMPIIGSGEMFSFAEAPIESDNNGAMVAVLTAGAGTAVGYCNLETVEESA